MNKDIKALMATIDNAVNIALAVGLSENTAIENVVNSFRTIAIMLTDAYLWNKLTSEQYNTLMDKVRRHKNAAIEDIVNIYAICIFDNDND